jgi:hypothetical protein
LNVKYVSKHTQASSKGRLRVDQAPSEPTPTTTPCLSKIERAVSLVIGGPGILLVQTNRPQQSIARLRATHIFLFSQLIGKGLSGVRIMPTPASASSLARKCASVAPVMVNRKFLPFSISYSDLRIRSVAIISAL